MKEDKKVTYILDTSALLTYIEDEEIGSIGSEPFFLVQDVF